MSSEQKVEECDLASLKLREGAAQQQVSNALVLVTVPNAFDTTTE